MHGTLSSLCAALSGARMTADAAFASVSTDSRAAGPGALFVALRGERFDAHAFLDQAAGAGAAAVVVEQLPPGWTLPAIVVPDTLVALGQMAGHWRAGFGIPVIGVTGSNGKTTVKEMIAAILAAAYGEDAYLATRGNLNNEIGVPLTVMRLGAGQRAAVVELGMNHPGEIARLSAIAAPTIALVNNAQREHQEFMHTVEAVARENGAVFASLPSHGVAVFPGDDQYTPLWRDLAQAGGARRTITFGLQAHCDVSGQHIATDFGSEMLVTVRPDGCAAATFSLRLAAAGVHNVRNALAAIGCALAAGIDAPTIVRGLEAFLPVAGRLQRKRAPGGATVIDDSYNANPDSVRAAIDVLAQARGPRILVLGDMGEVGDQGRQFHEEVALYAAHCGIERVFVTGELTRHMTDAGAQHFAQWDALLAALDACLDGASDATVLVKGSRFMQMERVVRHLLGLDKPGSNKLGSNNIGKDAH